MLARRVIPCLDVSGGRVVKGVRFTNLRDAGSPAGLAAAYETQGADEIVVLDVSATPQGRATQADTVRDVRGQLSIPLTVGGGVRRIDDARTLLEAGADKVAVNTAAVDDPSLLTRMAEEFGSQCTVVSIDAAESGSVDSDGDVCRSTRRWEVVVRSGTTRVRLDAVEWARTAVQRGAGEILLTSWDRDGTRFGYDVDLIRAVSQAVNVPVIASGGAASPIHLAAALKAGADAVLAASIFHDGELTVDEIKAFLAFEGLEIRR